MPTDIISRMEAMQQRFGRATVDGALLTQAAVCQFPSLLQSAENERRLQLNDREKRTFDGEDAEDWQYQSERQGAE